MKAFPLRGRWHKVPDEVKTERKRQFSMMFTPHQSASQTASPQGEAFSIRETCRVKENKC